MAKARLKEILPETLFPKGLHIYRAKRDAGQPG